jgi:hypothetical protein
MFEIHVIATRNFHTSLIHLCSELWHGTGRCEAFQAAEVDKIFFCHHPNAFEIRLSRRFLTVPIGSYNKAVPNEPVLIWE